MLEQETSEKEKWFLALLINVKMKSHSMRKIEKFQQFGKMIIYDHGEDARHPRAGTRQTKEGSEREKILKI